MQEILQKYLKGIDSNVIDIKELSFKALGQACEKIPPYMENLAGVLIEKSEAVFSKRDEFN